MEPPRGWTATREGNNELIWVSESTGVKVRPQIETDGASTARSGATGSTTPAKETAGKKGTQGNSIDAKVSSEERRIAFSQTFVNWLFNLSGKSVQQVQSLRKRGKERQYSGSSEEQESQRATALYQRAVGTPKEKDHQMKHGFAEDAANLIRFSGNNDARVIAIQACMAISAVGTGEEGARLRTNQPAIGTFRTIGEKDDHVDARVAALYRAGCISQIANDVSRSSEEMNKAAAASVRTLANSAVLSHVGSELLGECIDATLRIVKGDSEASIEALVLLANMASYEDEFGALARSEAENWGAVKRACVMIKSSTTVGESEGDIPYVYASLALLLNLLCAEEDSPALAARASAIARRGVIPALHELAEDPNTPELKSRISLFILARMERHGVFNAPSCCSVQ